jgi:hypothetical protein
MIAHLLQQIEDQSAAVLNSLDELDTIQAKRDAFNAKVAAAFKKTISRTSRAFHQGLQREGEPCECCGVPTMGYLQDDGWAFYCENLDCEEA